MKKRLAMGPQLQDGNDFDDCCGIVSKKHEVCVHIAIYIFMSVYKPHIPITILWKILDIENQQVVAEQEARLIGVRVSEPH